MIDKQKQKLNMKVQWAKFAVVLALYLLFLVWVESWLGLIDVYKRQGTEDVLMENISYALLLQPQTREEFIIGYLRPPEHPCLPCRSR